MHISATRATKPLPQHSALSSRAARRRTHHYFSTTSATLTRDRPPPADLLLTQIGRPRSESSSRSTVACGRQPSASGFSAMPLESANQFQMQQSKTRDRCHPSFQRRTTFFQRMEGCTKSKNSKGVCQTHFSLLELTLVKLTGVATVVREVLSIRYVWYQGDLLWRKLLGLSHTANVHTV